MGCQFPLFPFPLLLPHGQMQRKLSMRKRKVEGKFAHFSSSSGTPREDPSPCIVSYEMNVPPFLLLLCYPSGTLREDPGPCIVSYEMNVPPFLLLLCYPSVTPRTDPGPCIISCGINVSPFLLLLCYPSGTPGEDRSWFLYHQLWDELFPFPLTPLLPLGYASGRSGPCVIRD